MPVNKDSRHYTTEQYTQRMTAKEWGKMLLLKEDYVVFKGEIRNLIAKNLGYGIVEIYKAPKRKDDTPIDNGL